MKIDTILRSLSILSAAAALFAGCAKDNPAADPGRTPVRFRAEVPAARPAASGAPNAVNDGQTGWRAGDQVGLYMIKSGGSIPDDIVSGAKNLPFEVDPKDGTLEPADGQPLYYPMDGTVDFRAYRPHTDGTVFRKGDLYVDLSDQSAAENQAAMDLLFSDNATGIRRTGDPVELRFRHVFAKLRFDISLGEGVAGGSVSSLRLIDISNSPILDTWTGLVRTTGISPNESIEALKLALAATDTDADAVFTALVPPRTGGSAKPIRIEITVDGTAYTGTIPDTDTYQGNILYVYPVTVKKTGVVVAAMQIGEWTVTDQGSGNATVVAGDIEKVRIPAGTFLMGSPESDVEANSKEKPQHWVRLTRDFYMGKYEITQAQYARFLNDAGIEKPAEGITQLMGEVAGYGAQLLFKIKADWTPEYNDQTGRWEASKGNFPMTVTWYGAKAYADWAGGRLPTEAEWEYTCRAGTTTRYSFGDDAASLGEYAIYYVSRETTPAEVGSKKPNPWGLYDMHGNVKEWCMDFMTLLEKYPSAQTEAEAIVDPLGTTGIHRIYRGGSFGNLASEARSASRNVSDPGQFDGWTGFRVVFDF